MMMSSQLCKQQTPQVNVQALSIYKNHRRQQIVSATTKLEKWQLIVKATTMNFRGKKCIVEAIVDCCLVYWKEHRVEETFRSRLQDSRLMF
jgi:hypothetical protein